MNGPQPIKFVPPDERSSEAGRGPWILSATGKQLHIFDLRPEDIHIIDIAHALSMLCRFNGHCREFYSVAQHSVLVAMNLPHELMFQGLMHDATEAYCGDMVRPIKRSMPTFSQLEDRIWGAIADRFALPSKLSAEVKEMDNRVLQTERRDLLKPHPWPWTIDQAADGIAQPLEVKITPWTQIHAEKAFLDLFLNLTHTRLSDVW